MDIKRGIPILLIAALAAACGDDNPTEPSVQVTGATVNCPEGTHPVATLAESVITVTVGDTTVYCRSDQPPVVVTPVVTPVPAAGG